MGNDIINANAVKQGFTITREQRAVQVEAQKQARQQAAKPQAPASILSNPGFWALALGAFLLYRNS